MKPLFKPITLLLLLIVLGNTKVLSQVTGTLVISGPTSVTAGQVNTFDVTSITLNCSPSITFTSNVTWTVTPSGATITPIFPNASGFPSAQITFPNNCTSFTVTCTDIIGPGCPNTPGRQRVV
ncbi:MAG: hypothetical protein JWO03_802 [Bacteroidetes bacterium]|nr:hypothetical protein [Bacteroidota bacterium]